MIASALPLWALSLLLPAASAATTCVGAEQVHLDSGPIAGALVVIEGGAIREIRRDGGDAEGCDEVVRGAALTPGLVITGSQLGLVEVGMVGSTRDSDAGGGHGVRAAFQVIDGYNPRSSLIPIQRVEGVTSAVLTPSGGWVSGQGAWVDLAGGTQAEALVAPSVSMHAGIGRGDASRAAGIADLRALLDDARTYARARSAYERDQLRALSAGRLDLEALQPVLAGEIPLVIGADRAADIEALLRFQAEEEIRLVISGGAEAWIHADALAEAGVPVIIDPLRYGPGSFDELFARPDNGALLSEAGVEVILTAWGSHNARKLRQVAGNAVREGMSHDAALRAITATPAAVFGGEGRGAIAEGAPANLVLWSGDPLEIGSDVQGMWIRGEATSLENRQRDLAERYRALPGSPVPPLPLE